MHTWAVGIEDATESNFNFVHAMVIHENGFRRALAFVVARANTNRIHTTTIRLGLWMHFGIAVDFTGRGLKNSGMTTLGHPQQINRPHHRSLHGLDRIELVMAGSGGAGQIVNLIHFQKQRIDDVVPDHFEVRLVQQVSHIGFLTREKVIDANNVMALFDQPFTQM